MTELIMDHGVEFGAHRIPDDSNWSSEFKILLKSTESSRIGQSKSPADKREAKTAF